MRDIAWLELAGRVTRGGVEMVRGSEQEMLESSRLLVYRKGSVLVQGRCVLRVGRR